MYCAVSILVIMIFFVFERNGALIRAVQPSLLYGGVVLTVLLPWQLIKTSAHLVNSDVALAAASPSGIARQLYKIGPIVYEFQKQFFGPKKWNILWFIVAFAALANRKKVFAGTQRYLSIFLLLTACGYLFFYVVSHVEIHYFLSRTGSRFLIHFLPVAVYWLARLMGEDVPL